MNTSLFSIVQTDLFRINGNKSITRFDIIKNLHKPEFCYLFFFRCMQHYQNNRVRKLFFRILLKHFSIKYGYEIPYQCSVGKGLRLVHMGGIIINPLSKIGNNVTILRGVTIGSNRRGKKAGAPMISDNVWIGANAAIIGKVVIGNDVMIAPNSYINFNVPPHSICVGNPAQIIKREHATESYIDNPI